MPFKDIIREEVTALSTISARASKAEFTGIIAKLPLAYGHVPAIFRSLEAKTPGGGGLFSIYVSDLCKGCGECVQVCGDHDALRMTRETEELNAELTTAQVFSRLLPDTPQKFLGLYDDNNAAGSREAALRNHLMVRRNYEALVSGDGACAWLRRKKHPPLHRLGDRVLHAAACTTSKADRLRVARPRGIAAGRPGQARRPQGAQTRPQYELLRKTYAHVIVEPRRRERRRTQPSALPATRRKHGVITDAQLHRRAGRRSWSRTPSTTRSCSPLTVAGQTACP